MKKSNKGFTLVELLVVIAIMASILVLAITSLNGISKAKKKEAKKRVEDQIELAAKQYFEANEYLFEALKEGVTSDYVSIPLQELISKDYINTLTNPVTGKKYNKCDYVEVTKKNKNKYMYTFVPSNNNSCDMSSSHTVEVKPDKANCPKNRSITIDETGEKNSSNWYKNNILYRFTLKDNNNKLSDVSYEVNDSKISVTSNYEAKTEGENQSLTVKATYNGCSYYAYPSYNLDKTKPTIKYTINNSDSSSEYSSNQDDISSIATTKWINKKIKFNVIATDNLSGIGNVDGNNNIFLVNWNDSGKTSVGDLTKSGNVERSNDYIKCADKKCTYTDGKLVADGARYETYKVCDVAGNCAEEPIYVNIDTTAPTLTYNITSNWLDGKTANAKVYDGKCSKDSTSCPYNNTKWTNSNIRFDVTAKDALSGVNEKSSFSTAGTGSNESNSSDKGVFYVEWANENTETDETYFDIIKTSDKNLSIDSGTYKRSSVGYNISGNGQRRQSYTVCDKVGNCTTKTVYSRSDVSPPEIVDITKPNGAYSSSYCKNYSVIATRFKVRDNVQVYEVYHYMSNEDEDINKNKDKLAYFKEGFNSVQNGIINNYDSLKTQNKNFKQVTGGGTEFEITRYWADTDVSTANSIGCGTIAGNTKTPSYSYANQYCNFVSAMDSAGNKTVSRICGKDRSSSTNVKSK